MFGEGLRYGDNKIDKLLMGDAGVDFTPLKKDGNRLPK
jgi:hypothetical protein